MAPVHSLRNDSRGAIVVIALFMAVVLVGILQYLMNIGDTIVFRETTQDGADATAYAAAVYNARGMNVIAMVNLTMAAALAVLVALKIAHLIVTVANTVACNWFVKGVSAVFGQEEVAAFCAGLGTFNDTLNGWIDAVQGREPTILKALHKTEQATAQVMPWVAEARSIFVVSDYSPTMDVGFTASVSMFPSAAIDHALGQKLFGGGSADGGTGESTGGGGESTGGGGESTGGGGESTGGGDSTGGDGKSGSGSSGSGGLGVTSGRLGLPVSPDEFAHLCQAAGVALVAAPATLLETFIHNSTFTEIADWAGSILGDIVSTFPSYFCNSGSGVDSKKVAEEACQKGNQAVKDATKDDKSKKAKTIPNCKENVSSSVESDQGESKEEEEDSTDEETPMSVYGPADPGTDYYAVWSFAHTGALAGSDGWFFAEAEFYYDIGTNEFTFGTGPDQIWPEDAMWNMRWRARLRRTRTPTLPVAKILTNLFNQKASQKLESLLKNGLHQKGSSGEGSGGNSGEGSGGNSGEGSGSGGSTKGKGLNGGLVAESREWEWFLDSAEDNLESPGTDRIDEALAREFGVTMGMEH